MSKQRMWWALAGVVVCLVALGAMPGQAGTNITFSPNGGFILNLAPTTTTNAPAVTPTTPRPAPSSVELLTPTANKPGPARGFETGFDTPVPAATGTGGGLLSIGTAPAAPPTGAPELPAVTPPSRGPKLLDVKSLPIGASLTNPPAPGTVRPATPATTTNTVRSTNPPWLRSLRTTTGTTTASSTPTNAPMFKPLHTKESVLDMNYTDPYAYPMNRDQ